MVALWGTCFHLWSTWGGGWIKLCGKHDKIACGQCGEEVNCSFVENMFYLWSLWGGGLIQLCRKHGTICRGQCGEVVKSNLEENMFYTCGTCGEVARWIFLENMV